MEKVTLGVQDDDDDSDDDDDDSVLLNTYYLVGIVLRGLSVSSHLMLLTNL